ncbi:hypothetical protein [Halorubellus sp. PRR65]|uniref:hypothetical protein n=1 Tax=Halorubellus sp. PRR65 TaxID=3098148 RepID=UPI002B25C5C3|nr:hypothetical protein [Halorubellus sp. PRR65]
MESEVSSLSLSNRVVLLGLASLEAADETPVHAPAVRSACGDCTDALTDAVVGSLDEATVARGLNVLEVEGPVVRVDDGETSAVGKGRPAFALDAEVSEVLNALAGDEALAPAVEGVRERA